MAKKGPSVHVVPSKTQPGKFVAREAGSEKAVHSPRIPRQDD